MSRHTLIRTLAAALAVSALAAPTALARPADPPPAHKPAAKPERVQDLRLGRRRGRVRMRRARVAA